MALCCPSVELVVIFTTVGTVLFYDFIAVRFYDLRKGRKWKNENADIVARTQYLLVNSLTFISKEMQLRQKKKKSLFYVE